MSAIHLLISAQIKDGRLEALKDAISSLTELSTTHDGVDRYNFFVSDDGSTFHGIEEYRDEAALFGHVEGLGEALNPLMETIDGLEMRVLGNTSETVRGAFAAYGAAYSPQIGGFSR